MKSSAGRPSAQVFTMLFGVVYLACFYLDWTPFRYYPDPGRFHLKATPQDGPAIAWYGWVATAAVVSAVAALVVPRALAERLSPAWAWRVPVLTVIGILIYESRWFV